MRIVDCGPKTSPRNIRKTLTLADVFAGLSHYLTDRERIDSEIKRELAFNSASGLNSSAASLPRVGLSSLVDVA